MSPPGHTGKFAIIQERPDFPSSDDIRFTPAACQTGMFLASASEASSYGGHLVTPATCCDWRGNCCPLDESELAYRTGPFLHRSSS
jgi:hypothetical protein